MTMFHVYWETADNRKHYRTFGRYGEDLTDEDIKEAEEFCKDMWQNSVLKGDNEKGGDKHKIKNMGAIQGEHISWEKEETKVISKFIFKPNMTEKDHEES